MSTASREDSESPARSRLGLLWMLLATCCFVGMAAFVKLLREDGLTTSETMLWRMLPGLPLVWLELRLRGHRLWPEAPRLIVQRALLGLGAMGCYFYALRALTMIENAVLHLLQPVFVAVLSPVLLDERLRRSAVVALVIALTGALVVIRPDQALRAEVPLLPVVVGIAAAVFSALAHITVRKATAKDPPERVVFWFTLIAAALAGAGALVRGELVNGLPPGLALGEGVAKIAGMAGLGLAGQLLMTRAYGRAAAPMVAIVAYASIPLSVILDAAAWGVMPGIGEAVGSLLMAVAGVLLVRGRRS